MNFAMKRFVSSYGFIIYAVILNRLTSGYTLIRKYELDGDTVDILIETNAFERDVEDDTDFDPMRDTHFLLFTSKNIDESQILEINNTNSLVNSNFNPNDPIRIIIHGFRDGPNAIVNSKGRQAYASKSNYNVIVVDWSKGADTLNYLLAKERIYGVASVVAQFIDFMIEAFKAKISLSQIYIIGHSLGAHLAGVVGKEIKSGKVDTIFGLDPAAPFFEIEKPDKRLNKGDAEYVEIIHTDRGVQGFSKPIGDADFYPNWGKSQPGCGSDLSGACSHQRSALYWAESINSTPGFWAKSCVDYNDISNQNCSLSNPVNIKMGGDPSNHGKAIGVYYLKTSNQSPFALGPL